MAIKRDEYKVPLSVLRDHVIPREPVFVDLVERSYVMALMDSSENLASILMTISTGNLLSLLQIRTLAGNALAQYRSNFPAP